jgi:hypothetical protein
LNLWSDFQLNTGKIIHKWCHYFPIYERHLSLWRNRTVTVLEIGVSNGGSLQMWSRFFGPLSTVCGIDVDPSCARHERDGIHVRIGSQSDLGFLGNVIEEFGAPDIVIDDGSHLMVDIYNTFQYLYPRLPKNGVYIVEDLHTAYWEEFGGGVARSESFINISKGFVDRLNADHSRGAVESDFITRNTFSINFYDSVIVFERGRIPYKNAPRIGSSLA